MTTYFEGVTNNESKRYCAVSSYNTGVGNVCLAVSGDKIPGHTVAKINKMTAGETYRFLTRNLRYREAREYIVKVNTKYLMYKDWVKVELQ
jgi:membrane-bound lytic murein transglycosylase C